MKPKDMEVLESIAEYEDNTSQKEWGLGWGWRDVRVYPATLNRLVVEGLLETVFRSNSYTGYKLTERARAILTGGGPSAMEEEAPAPVDVPGDAFDDVLGHEDVKELVLAAMAAPRPVHVLLVGPPALAKSLFLWDLERVAGDRALWVLGSSSSKAGLQESLLEKRPWLLLIDELDKMDGKDMAALMSLMEGGRVIRTKVGRMADVEMDCRVVAASNTLRLPTELLSRFAVRRLRPYTAEEFRQVVIGLLQRREGLDEPAAVEVARALDGRTQDVRDAVRVARLAPKVGVKRAVELLLA
jgi:Holliday junction DNA helicase RuvB